MPWDALSFHKHNKDLSSTQSAHAARIANAVLKRSGDEGMAIAVANRDMMRRAPGGAIDTALEVAHRYARHLASGGDVGPVLPMLNAAHKAGQKVRRLAAGGSAGAPAVTAAPTPPPAPTAPTYATAAPMINGQGFVPVPQVGNYSLDPTTGALTPQAQQALQQYAQRGLPITGSPGPAAPSAPAAASAPLTQAQQQDQLLAQQQSLTMNPLTPPGSSGGTGKRGGPVVHGYAVGGMPTGAEMAPWFTRQDAQGESSPGGLIHGIGAGRTDNTPMVVAAGSHVIPADVVSGLGEGNTMAGAHAMSVATHTGPGGISLPKGPIRSTIPRPPSIGGGIKLARGGDPDFEGHPIPIARGNAPGGVKCIVANGEWLMRPSEVQRVTHNGKRGHDGVDEWIVERRKATIKNMKALPGPVKI